MKTTRNTAERCPVQRRPLCELVLAACGLMAGLPTIALAQGATGAEPQEVTVTARKRLETLIEVPISLQALSDKDLRAAAITNVTELALQTGFNFTSAQGNGAQGRAFGVTTFRGLQGDLNFPWENSGGVFIDGIFISGGVGSIGLTDVARVEVLKGPQNAFFGRSTFGGAVNFITRNPAAKFGGTVNASLNQHGSNDIDASIEGPLMANLLTGRITVGTKNKAAPYRASDGGDLGAEKTRYVTGTLYFTPTEDSFIRLRGHFQQDDDSTPATAYIPGAGNTSCTGKFYPGIGRDGQAVTYTPGTAYFCDGIPSIGSTGRGVIDANTTIPASVYSAFVDNSLNDPFLAKTPRLDHAGMKRETQRVSAQYGTALPMGMDLAVNAGFNSSNSTSIFDLDRTKTPNFINVQTNVTRDSTVDARLTTDAKSALRGVIGASIFASGFQLSQIDLNSGLGATAAARNPGNYLDLKSEVPAIYGSVEYDITKQITASVETRYQKDKITFTSFTGVPTSNETKNWLPRVTLRYKPDNNLSAYLNVARGVQPLTVNTGFANASAAGKAYILTLFPDAADFTPQPKLDSIELGVKQRVSRDILYAVAAYHQKWQNRLTSTVIFNPTSCGTTINTPACPFSAAGSGVTIGNEATVKGLELSAEAQLMPQFGVGAYVDVKRGTWDRYTNSGSSRFGSNGVRALTGDAVTFSGNKVARIPDVTAAINGTYRFAAPGGWGAYVRGDVTYYGKYYETDFNFTKTDPWTRLDLRVGFEKGNTALELFVKNVLNDDSWVTVARGANLGITPLVNFSGQGVYATAQEERAFGVRVRYTF